MAENQWSRAAVLTPLPPVIGTRVQMVLDPIEGDRHPVGRSSTTVVSVVGLL